MQTLRACAFFLTPLKQLATSLGNFRAFISNQPGGGLLRGSDGLSGRTLIFSFVFHRYTKNWVALYRGLTMEILALTDSEPSQFLRITSIYRAFFVLMQPSPRLYAGVSPWRSPIRAKL